MGERLKWSAILEEIAFVLLGLFLQFGLFTLVLPLFWAVFALWTFPRERQFQSTSY